MNKGIVAFLAFSCGGVMGFAAGTKLLARHYRQRAQEEIDSVKRAFRRQARYSATKRGTDDERGTKTPLRRPNDIPRRSGDDNQKKDYRAFYPESKTASPQEELEEDKSMKPYVIPPDEFDTIPGYETISLTLYADGTVADDCDNPMSEEDIAETIARESLKHFGEYEQDSVFVRNDDMRTDYEILLDERRYEDVLKSKPYLNPKK